MTLWPFVGRLQRDQIRWEINTEFIVLGVTEANDFYHLTLFSVEIFACTRRQLLPDPEFDAVTAIFYAIWQDGPTQNSYGLIATDSNYEEGQNKRHILDASGSNFDGEILIVPNEEKLFESLIKTVGDYDPDILIGYEIQRSSWGYLCRRAANLNINLTAQLSRMPNNAQSRFAGPNGYLCDSLCLKKFRFLFISTLFFIVVQVILMQNCILQDVF